MNKTTSIVIVYPPDISADEMVEISEKFGLWPYLGLEFSGEEWRRRWCAVDSAERMALAMLDELADVLGAEWELSTSTNKIKMTRKGGDDEGTDDEDMPEAA